MELSKITEFAPEIGLVLGSGLGEFVETLESPVYIPYKSLEGFPVSQVEGIRTVLCWDFVAVKGSLQCREISLL